MPWDSCSGPLAQTAPPCSRTVVHKVRFAVTCSAACLQRSGPMSRLMSKVYVMYAIGIVVDLGTPSD